jgi:AraC family transcriptional regulator of arabinose operon
VLLSRIDEVSAGTVTYPPGGTLGPRRQRDVQLVVVHSGRADVRIDGRPRLQLRAGEVGLLQPGHREHFRFAEDRPTRHSWVQAHVPGPPAELTGRLAGLPAVLPLSPALETLTSEAVAAAATPLSTASPLLAHLAAAALWRYVGEAERGRPAPARPVDDAQRHIHAHLGDPALSLSGIAAAAHVTPAHLVRAFRAVHGVPPMAYVWQRRVALAVDLLASTGLPLAVVAERSGFKTAHHLSRRVREATGMPPGRLRRDRWERSA